MSTTPTSGIRLVAENLWKSYGDFTAVRGVSFALEPGEILGLLGQNGAGKTSIVNMLYGSVLRTQGTARFEPSGLDASSSQARRQLGIVTQENNLDPDFTVRDNLILFAHHFRILGGEAEQRADQLIEMLHLDEHRNLRIEELSGGMQRRLVLARALIPDPQIIFLDEPTTGFDPDVRQEFWKCILDLRTENKSILLTTHYMDEAERLCDRLILLQNGAIVDEGTPEELVQRIIGEEILELSGESTNNIEKLFPNGRVRLIPYGTQLLLPVAELQEAELAHLTSNTSLTLRRRKANLEDVFLALTGAGLSSEQSPR